MTRKFSVFATVSMLLLIGLLSVTLRVGPVAALTITVPDDYSTIQEAINHASHGDVIFVRNGTYHENIHINKTLTIIGENRSNTIVDGYGVSIDHSDAVTITGFTIRNATGGIFLASSQHCRIYGNNILGNSGSAIFMFSCRNAVVFGNAITNNGEGISIVGAAYNTISENLIADTTGSGVRLGVGDEWANFNNISGNTIKGHEYGITFSGSYGNRIFGNNITGNNFGLNLRSGTSPCGNTYNDISENNIDGNSYGLYLYTGGYYFQSGFSKIFGNNIANNSVCGVYLGERSNNNTVLENDLKSNTVGLCIYKASNNTLYHNDFIQNVVQANISTPGTVNRWNDAYPNGGNHWSNYAGEDYSSGPHQNETGSDGIGDTPYAINVADHDNYPLIKPWEPFKGRTIHIRADGSADPSGASIRRRGDIYTLAGNITTFTDCIVVERDNMTLDGAGYTLEGTGNGTGIFLSQRNNVTIKNMNVRTFSCGIQISGRSYNNVLTNNNVTNCRSSGILIFDSVFNLLGSNRIQNISEWNAVGAITLMGSANNTIAGNTIVKSGQSMHLYFSSCNTISGNNITESTRDAIYLYGSKNCTISENNLANNEGGICLEEVCSNNEIRSNTMTNSGTIFLVYAHYNFISENSITGNNRTGEGIYLHYANGNTICRNNITGKNYGVVLTRGFGHWPPECEDNNVFGNHIFGNSIGVYLEGASNNTLHGNIIESNDEDGIQLWQSSDLNRISQNMIRNNNVGVRIQQSVNNSVYHNNFIQNAIQANSCDINTWDNGCEGNFWSDYNGSDTDSDGLGDTYLPWQGLDYYPLINPYWNPADVNHDLRVDIKDLTYGAKAFGSYLGHPNWNPRVDMNSDGKIDIKDLVTMAKSYGKTCWQ